MTNSASSTDAFPALTHSGSMHKLPSIVSDGGVPLDSAIAPQSPGSHASSPLTKTQMTMPALASSGSMSQTNLNEGLGASLLPTTNSGSNLAINEIKNAAPNNNRRRASVAVWADPRLMQISQQKLSAVASPQGSLSNLGGSISTLPSRFSNKSDQDTQRTFANVQHGPDSDAVRKVREEKAIYHILKFLDFKSVFSLRRVSKAWFKAARDRRLCQTLDLSPYNKKISNEVLDCIFNFYGMDVIHLILRQCWQVTDKGLALIGDRAKNIQTLDLHSCWDLTQAGISALCKNCNNLKTIDLSNCRKVDDTCIHNILSNHRTLESLSFSYCKPLSNNTMLFISQFCPRLRKLNLQRCTGIGDSGFQHWSRVQFKHLHELNLSDCSFLTDIAVALICQSCTYLTSLNLSFCCSLTEASILQISNSLAWLESLDISFCGAAISDNSLLVLSKALPPPLSPQNILASFAFEQDRITGLLTDKSAGPSAFAASSISSVATTMTTANAPPPGRCVLKRLSVRGCVRITLHGLQEFIDRDSSLEVLNASNCPNVNIKSLQNYIANRNLSISLIENGSLDVNPLPSPHNRRSTC